MKNLIACFFLSFYCIGILSASIQNDSVLLALEDTLQMQIDNLGSNHLNVSDTYEEIGVQHYYATNYNNAITSFEKSLEIRIKQFGENHIEIADPYNNLGVTYWSKGEYKTAINYLEKATNIRLKKLGEHHSKVALSYDNMALIYDATGDYERAIDLHTKALNIWLGLPKGEVEETDIATCYNNLATAYWRINDYEKSISLQKKALNIRLKEISEKPFFAANSYENLALVYRSKKEYEKAINLYNKALDIKNRIFKANNLSIAHSYNDLGVVFFDIKQYEKAINYHEKALNIRLEKLDSNNLNIAYSYHNIGLVYGDIGKYDKAIDYFYHTLNIFGDKLDENHPKIAITRSSLAEIYHKKGEYEKADSLWHIVINQSLKRLNDTYLFLSDNQRLEYAKTFKDVYNNFYSFAAEYENEDTKKLAAYLSLNTKSLALDYSISVRQLINNIDDKELKMLHNELNTLHENISQAELMSDKELREKNWKLDSLRNQQENLTRQLLQNKTLREKLYKTPVTWEDTQSQLEPDEATIDFVRFHEESDSTWMYYVILTRKNSTAPEFVRITDQEAINTLFQDANKDDQPDYIQSDNDEDLKTLYQKIWQPLIPHLKGIKTVHLSPSGLLHRIDFGVLQNANESHLANQFEFHYYNTMRDFTKREKTNWLSRILSWLNEIFDSKKHKNLLLFGDIAYSASVDRTDIAQLRSGLDSLTFAKEEIEEINTINLEEGGISIQITGNDAKEDTLKHHTENFSPDIIHFATHGKYLAPLDTLTTTVEHRLHTSGNPLQRSMLILSGGGDTWMSKEYIPRSDNDGILTAYEVSHLDLSDVKLVVLSACETGLGDIHDTEGVLGLQSAFKLAGVEHVLVSLWKVDDEATKNLMIAFYENLLIEKQDAPTALRNAKAEMREYNKKDLSKWAGFILIE